MSKIISITMSIIIMISVGFATPPINDSSMTTITASAKTKPSPQKKKAKPKKKEKAYSLYAERKYGQMVQIKEGTEEIFQQGDARIQSAI